MRRYLGPVFLVALLLLLVLSLAGCGSRTGLEAGVVTLPQGVSDSGTPVADAALLPGAPDAGSLPPPPQQADDAGFVASSLVLFGGLGEMPDGGYADQNDTWVWTAAGQWTLAHPAQSPSPRYGAMAASLGSDLILFGGDGPVAETWSWDGTTWTELRPSWSPPTLVSSVFARLGQDLLLFGGYNSGIIYEDVWRWDGATWTHDKPSVTPPPREAPAGAVLNGSLVIFGGEDTNLEPIGDTWVYDGTSWTQMQPAHSPSPRRGAVATAVDGKIVMFGGDTIPPAYGDWLSVDETWVWDGTDWTQAQAAQPAQSPEARSFAAMAAVGGQAVLFGGSTFGGNLGSPSGTWTWDGSAWKKYNGPGPGPRNSPTMATR